MESDVGSYAARDAQSWTEIILRAEVYDRVEEGGRREVQNPPGEENRQIAREPSTNVTE